MFKISRTLDLNSTSRHSFIIILLSPTLLYSILHVTYLLFSTFLLLLLSFPSSSSLLLSFSAHYLLIFFILCFSPHFLFLLILYFPSNFDIYAMILLFQTAAVKPLGELLVNDRDPIVAITAKGISDLIS